MFWPLQLNFEVLGVPKDSQVPISRMWVSSSHSLKVGLRHSESVKEVLKESLDLIALNFNEGTDQELCLQDKCLITNAISYDVLIGQKALFPPSFTIDN